MKILVTGANGFIGAELIKILCNHNFDVCGSIRSIKPLAVPNKNCQYILVGELDNTTDWIKALDVVDVVIHCAGRAHVLRDKTKSPIDIFRMVNVDATLHLAREAIKCGVRRFIFLSSIGVNGNTNTTPFTELDTPAPVQDYAFSKLEAENGLQEISSSAGMEIVIIRPPLVYGPNAPGNFSTLLRWMDKNIPLPFGSVHNKRSFVGINNLVDLILTCIEHPAAANQVFLVSDGEDMSTTELLNRVASSLGKKSNLIPVNQKLLDFCLKLIGKKDLATQLLGSLQIDISKSQELLNWTPPISIDEELRKTARNFLESQS